MYTQKFPNYCAVHECGYQTKCPVCASLEDFPYDQESGKVNEQGHGRSTEASIE